MKCKLLLRLHGKPKEKLTNGCRLYMSGNYALKHRAVCSKRSEYTECIKKCKVMGGAFLLHTHGMWRQ